MLFSTRRFFVGLFLSSYLLITGCEPAPDDDPNTNPKFTLLNPMPGDIVLDTDKELKIAYSGSVNSETICIELNGVDITDRMEASDISHRAKTRMLNIQNVLILGTNNLDVSLGPCADRPDEDFSKRFKFFFDDKAPHIEITRVTPSVTGADGRPAPGATLTVEGNIVDISDIVALNFNYVGGSVRLTESPNASLGDNRFTNVPAGDGLRKFRLVLPGYPDVSIPTGSPHFSYSIVDVHGQSFNDSFIASATQLSRKMAMQVNDGFLDNINPLLNAAIQKTIDLTGLVGGPEELVAGAIQGSLPQVLSAGVLNSISNRPNPTEYSSTRAVASAPYGASFCTPAIMRLQANDFCVVYLREITLDGLTVDTKIWGESGKTYLTLNLHANEVSVLGELAGIDYESIFSFQTFDYRGGITSRMALYNFITTTTFEIYTDPDYRFAVRRVAPITMDLTQWGKGPAWVDGQCSPSSICNNSATMAWAAVFYTLGMDILDFQAILDGDTDLPNSNGTSDLQEFVPLMESMLNTALLPVIDEFFDPGSDKFVLQDTVKILENETQGQITEETVANYIGVVLSKNAMTLSQGNYAAEPVFYTSDYVNVGGGLGSHYQQQGCYVMPLPLVGGSGCGNGFPEQLNHFEPMDIVLAIPSNTINQYLLAGHQTGRFDNLSVEIPGTYLSSVSPDEISDADTLKVTLDFGEAPVVDFKAYQNVGPTACIWILGQRVCTSDGSTPGSVKVRLNNLGLLVENTNSPGVTLLALDANVQFEVYVTSSNGLPVVSLKDNSVRVWANNIPEDLQGTPGRVSNGIAQAIEAYLLGDEFQANFRSQVTEISVDEQLGTIEIPVPGVGDIELPYAALLASALPRYYGVMLRQFTIEENGSYLSVGIDIRNSASPWTPSQESEHYLNITLDE